VLANRREKIIAIVTVAVLGLLVIDQYVLNPYVEERDRVAKALNEATASRKKADGLLKARKQTEDAWSALLKGGLKTDPGDAESQAVHKMREWSDSSHVDMQSLKPDRVARSGDFQQIRIQATGNATTAAFANLLGMIETATIPIRVNEFRLTSRKEGADDLTFALSVSTVVFSPAPPKASAVHPAPKGETR
jgi:hypothetical protein